MRCVKDKQTAGKTYPYITTASDGGVVIVLRDENGGVDEAALFPDRVTASPTGDELSMDNRLSRKFRVQKAQRYSGTLAEAVSYCDGLTDEGFSDWRLPTQRELQLIWALGGSSPVTSGDKNDTGVGETSNPICTSYLYQQDGFTAFNTGASYTSATLSESNSTNAWNINFYNGNTAHGNKTYDRYVRCVRDEW